MEEEPCHTERRTWPQSRGWSLSQPLWSVPSCCSTATGGKRQVNLDWLVREAMAIDALYPREEGEE